MKGHTSEIVSVSNENPDVVHFWLLGSGAATTLKGFFVNTFGKQTGIAVSTAIPLANASNDPVQLATSIPEDAVGFVGDLAGSIKFALFASTNTVLKADFKANYANYPTVAPANALSFGAVSVI